MSESVKQFLSSRKADSTNGRSDALVVQGGGMRGVYSMGALAAVEDAGLRESFDVVVGSSAGAINGAYLLAGQAHSAVDVYVEHLSNRKFVNPWRLMKIVDIDFLVDVALKVLCPLNVEAIRRSPSLLEIVLTNAATALPEVITSRREDIDLYEIIRATAALPGLYNKKIEIDGRLYIDGGVSDGVPVDYAASSGAENILTVVTRAPGFRRTDANPVVRALLRAASLGQSRAVRRLIGREDARFNMAMNLIERIDARPGLRTWTVWPSDAERLVGRTTSEKAKLRACASMGYDDMLKVLDSPVDG